ncbi:MAG TPA: 30S ribosomal protein S17 [Candidatus Peribacterales bacterium]|nr:30S ribosomal protein S17 [Candidatus Peribacterales bacterium]
MRTKKGTVTSAKMQNTVAVVVTRYVTHPIYKKRFPVSKKFLADTNGMSVHEGDMVLIGECKPLSKRKHFKVIEVLAAGLTQQESLEEELATASGKRKTLSPIA